MKLARDTVTNVSRILCQITEVFDIRLYSPIPVVFQKQLVLVEEAGEDG